MKYVNFLVLGAFLVTQGCSAKQTQTTPSVETIENLPSEGSVVILSTSGFFDSYSGYHIVGEIINNLSVGVKSIQLMIAINDSSGSSLLRDEMGISVNTLVISPHFDYLDIGERCTFDYYFDLSGGIPANYAVTIAGYETTTIQRALWSKENVQIFDYGDGYFLLTGEIVNQTNNWIGINHLTGGVRDDTGKVLSVEAMATYVSTLAPAGDDGLRDRTPFSLKIPIPSGTSTQWDLWCEAEPISEIEDYSLVIEDDYYYFDEFHTLHYVGMIVNNSDFILSSPLVVGLYMGDGSVLDVSYFLPITPTLPATRVPFDITNFGSYEWTDERVSLISDSRAIIDPGKTEQVENVIGLSTESESIEKSGLIWTIHGSFTNSSAQNIGRVIVVVSVYSSDTLLATGYGFSYPPDGKYTPGSTGEYKVNIYLPGDSVDNSLLTKTLILAELTE